MDLRSRFTVFSALALISFGLLAGLRSGAPVYIAARPDGPDFVREEGDLSHPLKIIVYGDTRFTDPKEKEATNPKVRRWLVEKIAEEQPATLLESGDLPWHGGDPRDYEEYYEETKSWRDQHLLVFPVLGNHEFKGPQMLCLENWWKAFPELRGRRWYSVQLGDSIYILNLDSLASLLPGSEQREWVQSQLEHLPESVRFVFFNMHHPPVVDVQIWGDADHNGRPNERSFAAFLAEAPVKSRVRFIVEGGHIHNYERFYRDGIVYIVSGGGGARPRAIVRSPDDLYQDWEFPNYHYVRFVEDGDRIDATMVRVADPDGDSPTWEEKDHFEIDAPER